MSYIEKLSRRDFLGHSVKLGAVGLMASCANTTASKPAKKKDGPWKIGCYTRPWNMYDYRVALDAIAEAGFKYAGLMTAGPKRKLMISISTTIEEAKQIDEEVKKRGLTVASVYGTIPTLKSVEASIKDLMKLIDNCAACGSQNLIMGGTRSEKLFDAYYKVIAECCDYAEEKKLEISIKPHGGLNATGAQCRKTVEMVGHKNFRIWYDPGNVYYYSKGKIDPVADAATVDGLVTGMCIKDYGGPKSVSITPGTGQVDFPALMARLRQGGFTSGPLIVECIKLGDKKQTLAEAKKVRQFLEELTG